MFNLIFNLIKIKLINQFYYYLLNSSIGFFCYQYICRYEVMNKKSSAILISSIIHRLTKAMQWGGGLVLRT